jgi:hypothetical protein
MPPTKIALLCAEGIVEKYSTIFSMLVNAYFLYLNKGCIVINFYTTEREKM